MTVHHRLVTFGLPIAARHVEQSWDLPVLEQGGSAHATGLRPRGTGHPLAITVVPMLPSAWPNNAGVPVLSISRLNTAPAHAPPVNASLAISQLPVHDSESSWIATPSM